MLKTHPWTAAWVSVGVLVVLSVVITVALYNVDMSATVANGIAGVATICGLILLAVADFVQMWLQEDGTEDSRSTKVRENFMTWGHSIVLVGALYLFVSYLLGL